MARPSKYSPELRERAVRLVQEHTQESCGLLEIGRKTPSSRRLADQPVAEIVQCGEPAP
jgi:hypothetical protein